MEKCPSYKEFGGFQKLVIFSYRAGICKSLQIVDFRLQISSAVWMMPRLDLQSTI